MSDLSSLLHSPQIQEDIDAAFKDTVSRAIAKVPVVQGKEKPTADVRPLPFSSLIQSQEDPS